MTTPGDVLRLLLDPDRLAVAGRAATGPVDLDALAAELDTHPKELLRAAGRLREAGILTDDLTLDREALRELATSLSSLDPASDDTVAGPWTGEEREVLGRFFRGNRLDQIPAARSKRLVVLERLAQEFEPGIRYAERRVNEILSAFHPDHAALRRYLVDEGFLTRADGVYWRSGGRYQVAGSEVEGPAG